MKVNVRIILPALPILQTKAWDVLPGQSLRVGRKPSKGPGAHLSVLKHSPYLSGNSLEIHNDGTVVHIYSLQNPESGEVRVSDMSTGEEAGTQTVRGPYRSKSPFRLRVRIALNGEDDVVFDIQSIGLPADWDPTMPRPGGGAGLSPELRLLANAIALAAELSHPKPPSNALVMKILKQSNNTNRYAKMRKQLQDCYGRHGLLDLKREAEASGDIDPEIIDRLRGGMTT